MAENSESGDFSREVAESLLQIHVTDSHLRREKALAQKARNGTLTDSEQIELEQYHSLEYLLDQIKSKARQSLKRSRGST